MGAVKLKFTTTNGVETWGNSELLAFIFSQTTNVELKKKLGTLNALGWCAQVLILLLI